MQHASAARDIVAVQASPALHRFVFSDRERSHYILSEQQRDKTANAAGTPAR
jgi:hypothetical protein